VNRAIQISFYPALRLASCTAEHISHLCIALVAETAPTASGRRAGGYRDWKQLTLLLQGFLFDVFDDVTDSLKFFCVFIWDFDPKFFFKSHHQFYNIERICP
jgi:hypothetical protein